jgi:hypothetical protein
VIDNGSTDGSTAVIKDQFPSVKIIPLGENQGFARACNVGICCALKNGARYTLLLNNDTVVAPDMITHLVRAMDISPAAGVLTPRIMRYGGNQIWFMGSRIRPMTLDLLDFGIGRKSQLPLDRMVQVDVALGAGMLVDRRVFERVGLLDETFFFYHEDIDFSLRVRQAGFEIWSVPWARMWHKVSASTEQRSYLRAYYHARGSVYFYYKHSAGWQRVLVLLYRLGSALRSTLRYLLRGSLRHIVSYWHGLCDGCHDLCHSLGERE